MPAHEQGSAELTSRRCGRCNLAGFRVSGIRRQIWPDAWWIRLRGADVAEAIRGTGAGGCADQFGV